MRSFWQLIFGAMALSALLLGAGLAWLLRGGISARPEPSAIEAALAVRAKRLAIPAAARQARNPIDPGDDVLAAARAHFADHCASCHGNDGRGQTPLGRAMYPRPPDLTAAQTQELTDGELFYLIENGIRFTGMPGFGGAGRPEESWKLVHFVRHLPRQTEEERTEMQRLNPRSAAEWRELQSDDAFLEGADASAPVEVHAHGH